MLFRSDGVSEAMSPMDEVFGMSRLVESLQAHGGNGLQDQVAALANELAQWQQPRGANDDITLLALEVTR